MRLFRALVALGSAGVAYGLAAQLASGFLPRRIWMTVHYLEDVELLPTYSSLLEETIFLIRSGILPESVLASTARVLAGLVAGTLAGVPVGLAMGRAARVEYLLEPWVGLVRFTPALALLPLYALWFGFGEGARVALVATAVSVVTVLGAYTGVRHVPQVYVEAAASLGARRALLWRRVLLPAALPYILASLRIAVAMAWVTLVAAELIRARMPGLGYLLTLAGAYPRVPTIMVGLATIGALVLLSDAGVLAVYARATQWMRRQHEG
jgi:ABC-type nitrate/sulfonate/bicarbonate transport system permease component